LTLVYEHGGKTTWLVSCDMECQQPLVSTTGQEFAVNRRVEKFHQTTIKIILGVDTVVKLIWDHLSAARPESESFLRVSLSPPQGEAG
jgi:hypothetical protein